MANKFTEMKFLAEELESLNEHIESKLQSLECDYVEVGEKQAQRWTGELLWEDEEQTVPKMTSVYDYVPKKEMTDYEKAQAEALKKIQKYLEKMI